MGQPVKLIIKKGAVRKDGTTVIFLQYCYNSEQRVLLNTDITIPPQYWNKRLGKINENLPAHFGDIDSLKNILTQKLRKVEDMVSYALKQRITCPMKFVKENFHLDSKWDLKQMSNEQKTLDVFWNIGDNRHYRIDLVFYHRILKCHVLLDLKIGEFDHADAGQMNMYLNYYKENKSHNGDNPPIGIILCNGKNEALVKYTTTGLPQKFFVSKYLVNLPSEKELLRIVAEEREKYYFLKCRFNFSWHHHGRKSYIGWIKWYLLVIEMKLFLLMGPYQLCQQVVIMHCP